MVRLQIEKDQNILITIKPQNTRCFVVSKIYRVFTRPSVKLSMGISKTVHRAQRMAQQVRAHIPSNLTS